MVLNLQPMSTWMLLRISSSLNIISQQLTLPMQMMLLHAMCDQSMRCSARNSKDAQTRGLTMSQGYKCLWMSELICYINQHHFPCSMAGVLDFSSAELHLMNEEQLKHCLEYFTKVMYTGVLAKSNATHLKMINNFNKSYQIFNFPEGSILMAKEPKKRAC